MFSTSSAAYFLIAAYCSIQFVSILFLLFYYLQTNLLLKFFWKCSPNRTFVWHTLALTLQFFNKTYANTHSIRTPYCFIFHLVVATAFAFHIVVCAFCVLLLAQCPVEPMHTTYRAFIRLWFIWLVFSFNTS